MIKHGNSLFSLSHKGNSSLQILTQWFHFLPQTAKRSATSTTVLLPFTLVNLAWFSKGE